MLNLIRPASTFVVALIVAACSSGAPATSPSSPSLPPSAEATPSMAAPSASIAPSSPAPSTEPSAAGSPIAFTSKTYGYSLTVPAGWTAIQATKAWDGKGAPFHDVPEADQFVGPAAASAWFFGAPTSKDLAGRVAESIAANAAAHGDTCPAVPEVNDPIKIGSIPGVLLGYNCGILINSAMAVDKGKVYLFGFRDPAVHAATDPADRAQFVEILKSVKFPD